MCTCLKVLTGAIGHVWSGEVLMVNTNARHELAITRRKEIGSAA